MIVIVRKKVFISSSYDIGGTVSMHLSGINMEDIDEIKLEKIDDSYPNSEFALFVQYSKKEKNV